MTYRDFKVCDERCSQCGVQDITVRHGELFSGEQIFDPSKAGFPLCGRCVENPLVHCCALLYKYSKRRGILLKWSPIQRATTTTFFCANYIQISRIIKRGQLVLETFRNGKNSVLMEAGAWHSFLTAWIKKGGSIRHGG